MNVDRTRLRPARRLAALTAAAAVVATGIVVTAPAPDAEARIATGGTGLYVDSINWIEWGTANGTQLPNAGFTGTTTQAVGDTTITITCTTSNITSVPARTQPVLETYRPGTFFGDGFEDMYNIGGTSTANQLISGLGNGNVTGSNLGGVTYDVSCSATADGVAIPLAGLVYSDAETSGGVEAMRGTPLQPGGTWRIIDRFRTPGCTLSSTATLNASNTITLGGSPTGTYCRTAATQPAGGGPIAVAFLEGATSMQIN